MLEPGEEKNTKGHLLGLGKNSIIRGLFINLNFINDKSSDPVKVDGAYFYFTFESLFNTLNGDLFDQPGEDNAVKIKSQGG